MKRTCLWCDEIRTTTNKEENYIGEPCLRSFGKNELLRILKEKKKVTVWDRIKEILFG